METTSITFKGDKTIYAEPSPPELNNVTLGPNYRPVSERLGISGEGLLASARTSHGVPVSGSDITEDALVRFPGSSQMTVKEAVSAGLLKRNDDGSFSEVIRKQGNAKANNGASGNEAGKDVVRAEAFSRDTEASFEQLRDMASPSAVAGAILAAAKGEEFSDSLLEQAASEMRMEPDALREQATAIREAFSDQAHSAIESLGLDSEAFFEWAWKEKASEMRQAVTRHARERTTQSYRDLANAYLTDLPRIAPEAILNAEFADGIKARKAADGKIILETPIGEIEWTSAMRKGFLKVSRAGR